MKTGIVYRVSRRQAVCHKLKRQVVTEFKADLAQATGWKRDWLRWKRGITLEMRYNELLFAGRLSHLTC